MLNLRPLQDKKISAKHSEIDIESEGKVLNLRWLRNRKIFGSLLEMNSEAPLHHVDVPDSPKLEDHPLLLLFGEK